VIQIDQEFKELIPALTKEEYEQLEANILAEGVRDSLLVWNGVLIDGHNRYEIATKHGLSYDVQEKEFADRAEAERWIILNQFGRRNLSAYDRSVLALKLKPIIEAEAKKNQGTRTDLTSVRNLTKVADDTEKQDYQKSDKADIFVSPKKPIDTKKEIAKAAGVSHDTIAKVEKIQAKATPEVKAAVKSGEMSINQAYQAIRKEEKKSERQELIKEQIEKPKTSAHIDIFTTEKKYRVIYADPPWQYNDKQDTSKLGGACKHYPTMPLEDICALRVPTEKDAVLFLWTTSPMLEDSFKVINSWGFKYKSSFIWDKVSHAMGHYNSVRHEFLLICTKGSCTPDVPKLLDSVVSIERTEHSVKPKEFRDMIDMLYPVGERLEMFAREAYPGWDVWGNMA
jgi:N6-adenosine-specific RNA methylase IME4/DNA-binding XRE family transcriptional regulator